MAIEYEATYLNINKNEFRKKLKSIGANLVRSEYKQKRYNFDLQSLGKNFWEWVRIRDEGNKVSMAYKCIPVDSLIEQQKETEFTISNMDVGVEFMKNLGARITNYSETLRECWILNGVEIDIDTWPYLEPFVEIEGKNKNRVIEISKLLGFNFKNAKFCGAGEIYKMKYGIHLDKISKNKIIYLTFENPNPFII